MNPNLALQLIAWFLALIFLIVGLYILLLNARHTANRHTSALLLILAINDLAIGLMIGATDTIRAALPSYLLAATSPAIQVALLIVTVILLKPGWIYGPGPAQRRGGGRWVWWPIYGLVFLPALLTLADVGLGTRLWYTALDAKTYVGGYVPLSEYTAGSLSRLIWVLNFYIAAVAPFIPLLYIVLRDPEATPLNRWLAWLLLGAQTVGVIVQMGLRGQLDTTTRSIMVGFVYSLAYAYATFQQMISERRLQRGRLRTRLTLLVLAITVPVLASVVVIVTDRARDQLEQDANERLRASQSAIRTNTEMWLDLHIRALQQLVSQPDIISMDPARQKPTLQAMAAAYPYMYLVSTIGLDGLNVARSDSAAPMNYSDRQYFRSARDGAPLSFQVLIGRTTNKPALVVSMPIKDSSGKIVGVGMFASELTKIAENLQNIRIGQTGYAYIVSADNYLVAHPNSEVLLKDNQLVDVKNNPPVKALRQRQPIPAKTFADDQGVRWRFEAEEMNYGWAVVVQQQEAELFSSLRLFQNIAWGALAVGAALLLVMAWLTFRQAFRPINLLMDTVAAITAGDLTRTAPIESEDEIGLLARAFNDMTGQLRELIGGLEQRVAERTRELETRSRYLEAAAQVGQAASSILDSDQLIRQVVELIREEFGLYYVGLFLADETDQWAVLRAGTGPAGQAMLSRGHRLPIGEKSMVGWCIAHRQARVALEAGEDAVRLATPELPGTRSEAALPLHSRGRVFGAVTVQSDRPNAFDPVTLAVLQTMADQVAVALDNARLFAESRAALEASGRASAQLSREGWVRLLTAQPRLSYLSTELGVADAGDIWRPEMEQAWREGRAVRAESADDGSRRPLAVPIKVRGEVIGVLDTYRPRADRDWTPDEITLLETFADQLGVALESARLYQDAQRRAWREQLTGEVTARLRASLDLDTVLETALDEIHQAMKLDQITIHLAARETGVAPSGNGRE